MAQDLPALPEGFEVQPTSEATEQVAPKESNPSQELPALPEGFELQQPRIREERQPTAVEEPISEADKQAAWDKSAEAHPISGRIASAISGVGEGLPFATDIAAAGRAGLSYLKGGEENKGTAAERFARGKEQIQRAAESARKAYPVPYYGAQIGSFFVPFGGEVALGAKGAKMTPSLAGALTAAERAGAEKLGGSTAAKIASGAGIGAGFGAAQGFGEGTSLEDRAKGALSGAGIGSVIGGGLPAITKGATAAAKPIAEKFKETFPGLVGGAEKSALERIGKAVEQDTKRGKTPLTQQEIKEALNRGQDIRPIDIGSESLRDEARAIANTHPEAYGTMADELRTRFEGQQDRFKDYLSKLAGHDVEAADTVENLIQEAQNINEPAYKKAYNLYSEELDLPGLDELSRSPAIKKAREEALNKAKNLYAAESAGAANIPGAEPSVLAKEGSLQYWDNIKKSLDGKVNQLYKKGNFDKARDIKKVRDSLVGALDQIPEYESAKSGAASAFGEQDAFSAGLNYLGKGQALSLSKANKAFQSMGEKEKDLFQKGVLNDLMTKIRNKGQNIDATNLFDNKSIQDKLRMVLGDEKFSELNAFNNIERLTALTHRALQGNSTTAKQLSRMGAGVKSIGKGLKEAGLPMAGFTAGGPFGAFAGYLANSFVENLSSELGKKQAIAMANKLVSKDPQAVQEVYKELSRHPGAMNKLENINNSLRYLMAGKLSQNAAEPSRPHRASGGKIEKRDYPAKRLTRMEKALARAQRALAEETKPIMNMPDDHVAHALEIAKEK